MTEPEEDDLARARAEIAARHEEIAALIRLLETVERERGETLDLMEALRRSQVEEIAALREARSDAATELARLREEVRALRASRSWRLTAPLRAVSEWLSRRS